MTLTPYRARKALPRHTCPSIDAALRVVHDSELDADEKKALAQQLEELRTDNTRLRDAAEEAIDKWEAAESRFEREEERAEEAERELQELRAALPPEPAP
jgi:hypothetical protein